MFNIFRKKTKEQILKVRFEKLIEESYQLSKINRMESDKKFVEAQKVLEEIDSLKA